MPFETIRLVRVTINITDQQWQETATVEGGARGERVIIEACEADEEM
jgi:hypothetical protein